LTGRLAATSTLNFMTASPQRLALDLQKALQDLKQEKQRTQQLLQEMDRQNHELDRLRSSVHRESNSRLLAEEALDETRDRLQLAVDAARLALWDWQLPSHQVFLTARWGEMLDDVVVDGYWDRADLLARVHEDDRPALQALTQTLLTGAQRHAVAQFRVRRHDGWLWIESHGMVAEHDAGGRPLRLMGTHADITERKRLEATMDRARMLAEEASRAKSEFLANMSHEVRTPLNALMGLTRLLMDSPINAEQRSWLDLMDTSAHALLDLLNDVLDLSRIEAGKMTIEAVAFPLRSTLQELVAMYTEQGRQKSQGWTLQLDSRLPESVVGDPVRLRQVVTNLLSNALKFTPRAGRVHVSAEVVAEAQGQPARWVLQVRDTGVGIAPRHQAAIFQAFTQADASTSRRFGGSGLGLAICARLVQLMGGAIDLVSELGQGSTFTVTWPLKQAVGSEANAAVATATLEQGGAAEGRFAGLTVLLAEDHPVNELLLTQLMRRWQCTVRHARNGDHAVELWAAGGVDLILMDVQMPGTDGLQATQQIRALERRQRLPRTPIVAVTANAMKGDREACLAADMDGYATKPVDPEALSRAMDEALLRRQASVEPAVPESPNTDVAAQGDAQGRAPSAAGALDLNKLRRRLDGDEVTLHQLALAMRGDLATRLDRLQRALEGRDAELAIAHAHGLKGSLGSMTADRGARLAKGLELAALARDWSLFERALPLMRHEASRIESALTALLNERSSPGA
jgi:signal transduction histidine kinase/DNA-binding response OmpR family regulator